MRAFLILCLANFAGACGSATSEVDASGDDDATDIDAPTETFDFSVTPETHDFADATVGSQGASVMVTVKNTGTGEVTITRQISGDSGEFTVSAGCNGESIAPGGECAITAQFTPQSAGNHSIVIEFAAAGKSKSSTLTGEGLTPGTFEVVGQSNVNEGTFNVGSQKTHTFTFKNIGQPVQAAVSLTLGNGSTDVTKTADDCNGQMIPMDGTCSISLKIDPSRPGPESATIGVSSGNGTTTAVYQGTGRTTVTINVSGDGSTSENPTGQSCNQSSCVRTLTTNLDTLTVNGVPDTNTKYLSSWSSCPSVSGSVCSLTLSQATFNITANFGNKPSLTVNTSGLTNAAVARSGDAGIDCSNGNDCEYHLPGDQITLTASPAANWKQWSGCTSNTRTCTVTMGSSNKTVTAQFNGNKTLTIESNGNNGVVSGSTLGACGPNNTCQYTIVEGTQVNLSANGNDFKQWTVIPSSAIVSGCGTSFNCTINVNANTYVTGQFGTAI